jgi:hypothetical protein
MSHMGFFDRFRSSVRRGFYQIGMTLMPNEKNEDSLLRYASLHNLTSIPNSPQMRAIEDISAALSRLADWKLEQRGSRIIRVNLEHFEEYFYYLEDEYQTFMETHFPEIRRLTLQVIDYMTNPSFFANDETSLREALESTAILTGSSRMRTITLSQVKRFGQDIETFRTETSKLVGNLRGKINLLDTKPEELSEEHIWAAETSIKLTPDLEHIDAYLTLLRFNYAHVLLLNDFFQKRLSK